MAQNVEPMDIDNSVCDFDDKENNFRHNNVLPRTPCTEKGYEELDVSELNMKLRYSITPASSPMSKSYTAYSSDNRTFEPENSTLDYENSNMTRSLHTTLTNNDSSMRSQNVLPLQVLSTDHGQVVESNRNILRPLDSTTTIANNVTITVSGSNDIDEIMSLPSLSSSIAHTPEATTPTKDIPKEDAASPIIRGLKSVLNMFRPSQSPIPSEESEAFKPEVFSPPIINSPETSGRAQIVSVSTPLAAHKTKNPLSRKNSPNQDSLVFNEDLETELQWKDDSTIIFSEEKIPIHKLLLPQSCEPKVKANILKSINPTVDNLDATVEYMDVSYNDSVSMNKSESVIADVMNKSQVIGTESDSEFVDCESTFTKNESRSEQSFLSQQDENLIKAVEQKSFNTTTETLNASPVKSADVSSASTDTTKPVDNLSAADLIPTIEHIIETDSEDKVGAEEIVNQVINNPEPIQNVPIDEIKTNLNIDGIEANTIPIDTVDKFKIHDNTSSPDLGVKSLSQIPLIVDPRVLLFNIPSKAEIEVKNEKISDLDVLNTSPADVPLPDDDDIDEVPSMQIRNFVVESNPQINESKEDLINPKGEIKEPTSHEPTINVKELKESVLPATVSNIEPTIVSQSEPDVVEDCSVLQNINILLNDLSETLEQVEDLNAQEIKQVSNSEKLIKDKPQDVESMAISISEDIILPEVDQTTIVNEPVVNGNTFIPEAKVISIDTKVEFLEAIKVSEDFPTPKDFLAQGDCPDLVNDIILLQSNNVSFELPIKTQKSTDAQEIENNKDVIENIKQEVEAIVTAAINIVSEKSIESNVIINKIHELEVVTLDPKINKPQNIETFENIHATEISSDVTAEMQIIEALNVPIDLVADTKLPQVPVDDVKKVVTSQETVLDLKKEDALEPIPISDSTEEAKENIPEKMNFEMETNVETIDKIEPIIINDALDVPIDATSNNQTIHVPKDTEIDDIAASITSNDVVSSPLIDQEIETKPQKADDKNKMKIFYEEVAVSENNSPFVFVSTNVDSADKQEENFEEIENSFVSNTKITTPPASPKIASKGYNFNFDEIEDPFATKTKIRQSPPPNGPPKQSFKQIDIIREPPNTEKELPKRDGSKNNRRKSQPTERKPPSNKKRVNSTFTGNSNVNAKSVAKHDGFPPAAEETEQVDMKIDSQKSESTPEIVVKEEITQVLIESTKTEELNPFDVNQDIKENVVKDDQKLIETSATVSNVTKESSSSEQSTYFSAGVSSNESFEIKNTFKLPEIDDPNFNPFATKTKVRQSPPPSLDDDPFATKSKIRKSPEPSMNIPQNIEDCANDTVNIEPVNIEAPTVDNIDLKQEERDSSGNLSNITSSSKTDKDNTIQTVNTEDEDTVEGPFLESEDLNNEDKMSDFDGENVDVMQFSELPPENIDSPEAGELFIDAEAFEFLLNQNKCSSVADSGKESLFLKFDPLFAKRISSDGVVSALKHVEKRQSTPKKTKPLQRGEKYDKSPVAGPSVMNMTQDLDINNTTEESVDDLNITVSKPMMVVNPAVNPIVTPRNKSITPVRSNRQSLTFTSPAIAVIDRLLSMSSHSNNSMTLDTTVAEVNRDNEADLALTQLRELLADKEISVYTLRSESKDLKDRLASLESQMKSLEAISEERLKKINELNEKLNEKTQMNKSMAKVVEEYERTIASLIAETEQDKKRHAAERVQLIKERDEQTAHLASMEVSFSDLHSKYEKSKQVILGFKANEDMYKKSIKDFEENLAKMQINYESLKQHATSKLNHANEELQKINRSHEAEVLKLNAMIKRKELHITSLEETLQQKTKANEELTAICDELINKVG